MVSIAQTLAICRSSRFDIAQLHAICRSSPFNGRGYAYVLSDGIQQSQPLLLLPLLARAHRHAPILRTIPVNHTIFFRSGIQTCTTGCWPSPPACPYSWLPLSRALPGPGWLPGSAAVASPVAPTPPAVPLRSDPIHSSHPLRHPWPRPAPITASPLLLIASLLPASARNSSPCACSRWLSLCSHPTPPAPASSSPPATRSATLDRKPGGR